MTASEQASSQGPVYRIGRRYIQILRACGYLYIAAAAGYIASVGVPETPLSLSTVGVGLFGSLWVMSEWLLRRLERYSLTLSREQLIQASPALAVPWSRMTGVRERRLPQRLEVMGADGPTGIRVEHQLERLAELLDWILARIPYRERAAESLTFTRPLFPRAVLFGMMASMAAIGLWGWFAQDEWAGLGIAGLTVVFAVVGAFAPVVTAVEISDEALTIRHRRRSSRIALEEISSLDLAVSTTAFGSRLSVVALAGEDTLSPIPAGANAIDVYLALRDALALSRGVATAMSVEQFWTIVERAGAQDDRASALWNELSVASVEALHSFCGHYVEHLRRAYRWELWGAAYFMNGDCSDECFLYFRDWLISEGRDVFEQALESPDSLAKLLLVPQAQLEAFGNVPFALFDRAGGDGSDFPSHPKEPVGEPWREEDLPARLPALARRYQTGLSSS